jgi:hypothetical protein
MTMNLKAEVAARVAVAAAAWRQRGIGDGGTINNQLKALAATASEMATMTATKMTKKTKVTATAVVAWRQLGGSTAGWRQKHGDGGGSGRWTAWQPRGSSMAAAGSTMVALAHSLLQELKESLSTEYQLDVSGISNHKISYVRVPRTKSNCSFHNSKEWLDTAIQISGSKKWWHI